MAKPPLILDPIMRATGYHARKLARLHERRTRAQPGGDDEAWSEEDDDLEEEVDELPDPGEEHIGKRKHVRGDVGQRDRIVHARQLPDDTVEWVDQYDSAEAHASPPFDEDFWNFNGWTATGPGNVTTQVGTAAHQGVVRVATGATSGNIERLHLGTGATDTLMVLGGFDATFIVSPQQTAAVVFRSGFSADWSAATPANWVGFEYDSANANWHFLIRVAGVTLADTDLGVAVVAGNWYRFRVRNGSAITLASINGGTETSVGTLQTVPAVQPGFQARTTANVTKQLDADYYRWQSFGLVR